MFRFKQFIVNDECSTMKVGTDALLVSALSSVPESGNILDIGTGCGVIALLLAQQTNCHIDAIDVDTESVIEAGENFKASTWNDRLEVLHTSVQDFCRVCSKKYMLIVSNPPFFNRSLKSENSRRNLARHNDSLSLEDLFSSVSNLLSDEGSFCVILPADLVSIAESIATEKGLCLNEHTQIITKEGKQPGRSFLKFTRSHSGNTLNTLTISDSDDRYTEDYIRLMKPFLTIFS